MFFVLFNLDDKNTHSYANFLKNHSCYDIIPNSTKIVVFDTSLKVCFCFLLLFYCILYITNFFGWSYSVSQVLLKNVMKSRHKNFSNIESWSSFLEIFFLSIFSKNI